MKQWMPFAALLLLAACNPEKKPAQETSDTQNQITGNWIEVMPANPQFIQGVTLNEVTIHRQEHSGDGVFQAALNYLEAENGKDRCDIIYGRQYTLRGHSGNKNATVLELISFDQKTKMFFEKKKDQLVMLDQQMNPIDSKLNYTLNRQ